MQFDSFPALWLVLIRGLAQLGLASDPVLRGLGLLVGLATLATLWINSRRFGTGLPLITLALLGLNSTVICWGNSNRAFGLGLFFSLLLFSAIWRAVETPCRRNLLLALGIALLAVHTLFYNAVILLALGVGAAAVAVRRRDWKPAARVAGIGVIAALSLLPYLPVIRGVQSWNDLLKTQKYNFTEFLIKLGDAFSGGDGATPMILWILVLLGALILGVMLMGFSTNHSLASGAEPPSNSDLRCFALGTLCAGFFFYFGFLKVLSYPTTWWYYLALMGLMATAAEILLLSPCSESNSPGVSSAIGLLKVLAPLTALLVNAPLVWHSVALRCTNVDRIAGEIETSASKDDLVVISAWALGISFQRYYHGATPWITVPAMPGSGVHRFDRIKALMCQPDPVQGVRPVIEQIHATLAAGKKVWFVGGLAPLQPGEKPHELPPAPIAKYKWSKLPYYAMWEEQFSYFVLLHATKVHTLFIPVPNPVRPMENLPLCVASGWR